MDCIYTHAFIESLFLLSARTSTPYKTWIVMDLLSDYAIPLNQNVVRGGAACMYPVQERLRRPQPSDVAMQLLQGRMAHL